MTARAILLDLLRIHNGACSVPTGGALEAVAGILQLEGLVDTRPSGTPHFLEVYVKGFRGRFNRKKTNGD